MNTQLNLKRALMIICLGLLLVNYAQSEATSSGFNFMAFYCDQDIITGRGNEQEYICQEYNEFAGRVAMEQCHNYLQWVCGQGINGTNCAEFANHQTTMEEPMGWLWFGTEGQVNFFEQLIYDETQNRLAYTTMGLFTQEQQTVWQTNQANFDRDCNGQRMNGFKCAFWDRCSQGRYMEFDAFYADFMNQQWMQTQGAALKAALMDSYDQWVAMGRRASGARKALILLQDD